MWGLNAPLTFLHWKIESGDVTNLSEKSTAYLVWTHLNWRLLRLDAMISKQDSSNVPWTSLHLNAVLHKENVKLNTVSCRSMDSFSMFLRNCPCGDSQSFHVNRVKPQHLEVVHCEHDWEVL